jgi:hypothetical protein
LQDEEFVREERQKAAENAAAEDLFGMELQANKKGDQWQALIRNILHHLTNHRVRRMRRRRNCLAWSFGPTISEVTNGRLVRNILHLLTNHRLGRMQRRRNCLAWSFGPTISEVTNGRPSRGLYCTI